MTAIDDYLATHRGQFEEELKQLLRIPSVSADSKHAGDVRQAAQFLVDKLQTLGLETELIETEGHPLVAAEWRGAPGAPTVLLYGHYDVQPPDPLDEWITGAFEPTVRDGNLYARGATDDKGQMYTHLLAIEAWLKTEGKLPVNVKLLIEGEEEVGSHAIEKYLAGHPQRFACDCVVVSDGSMFGPDAPAVTYGLRGLAYFELRLQGSKQDLHSGGFGGSVVNPLNALCSMLAQLKDEQGRVRVPGFYDQVAELTPREAEELSRLPFDEGKYRRDLGAPALFGEKGYNTIERKWVRPAFDINGISGGYQGEGAKTVIPAKASAKFSFRLVPDQDPQLIEKAVRDYLTAICPRGVDMELVCYGANRAVVVPLDCPAMEAGHRALQAAYGVEPLFIREGGSIPIVLNFKQVLGADTLLLGFGLPDDNPHSPNEKFCLKDFHRGIKTMVYLFQELASLGKVAC